VTTTDSPEVEPGQVWENDDPRMAGHRVRVERITRWSALLGGDVAVCTVVAVARNVSRDRIGRTTRIKVRRMRPGARGYRLVQEG